MPVNSLLVKLPNWMGDILFSYDLLFSLSRHIERLGICTSRQHAKLLKIFPIPNAHIIDYPENSWPHLNHETISKIFDFDPEWGLLLPNSIGSALVFRKAGVRQLAGFDTEKRGRLLARSRQPPAHRMHQVDYYLELLKMFDIDPSPYPLAISSPKSSMVVLHPGASKMQRAWHLERFLKVAEALRTHGREILFVSGTELDSMAYPVAVKPSLEEFTEYLKKCELFVGNDSGPLHLAQQCGAPVVGVYGPGDPYVTGPRRITPARVVSHFFPCSPCRQRFFKDCDPAPTGKPYCIETISTQEVVKAALELLGSESRL